MLLYLIYALYHKVACRRLISIEILLFDVLALLKYCWKQVTLTDVIWNDRTFHASVLLVEDPKTLRFFLYLPEECCRQERWGNASSLTRLSDLIDMSHLDLAPQWWKMGILWRRWDSSKLRTAWRSARRIRWNDSRRKYMNCGMYETFCNMSWKTSQLRVN